MKIYHLLIFTIIWGLPKASDAAFIEKVKGKKVLIALEGMSLSAGDTIESLDPNTQKKTAILKVTKVKNDKAIATILKGKAEVDQEVHPRSIETPENKSRTTDRKETSTFALGAVAGMAMNATDLQLGTPKETIAQTGTGFSLMGVGDYKFLSWLTLRGLVGIEQFNVKGDSTLVTTTLCDTCETEILYFTAIAWAKIQITETYWVGPGLGLQQPLNITSNAIKDFSTCAVYGFGAGADFNFRDDLYIPVQIEYGLQPESTGGDVSSSYYGARIGLMLRY